MKIGCDIDGTLLDYNYIPGQIPAVNWPLIRQLRERTDTLTLITNQGGLPWGVAGATRKDGRAYPQPADFVGRFVYLVGALALWQIEVTGLLVCTYHPKAPLQAVQQAAYDVDALLSRAGAGFALVYHGEAMRKPSSWMLDFAEIDCYYGDSDEDEQAAQAAGCDFVRVERFFG